MKATKQLAVPFNKGYLTGAEPAYLQQAMANGPMTGDGPFTKRANQLLNQIIGARHTLLTTSCTHALDMTALLLDLGPGDEVILPSFTFCSTANAYALRGARPVFVDCRADTLNIDERLIEAAVTDRTRAIVVVHYAGVAAEMDAIMAVARRHDLVVIEDNAHGLGGTYRGRNLGSIGELATQSFHETKNVHCGEGGALILNDDRFYDRAEIIREKGTNRGQFFRGMVDKYRWMDLGSSYLPSDLLAAFLTAQLEHFPQIQRRRMHVWNSYHNRLATWAVEHGVIQPTVPSDRTHPAHLYYLLLPDLQSRSAMLGHLLEQGVLGTFHYQPLHLAPAGQKYGRTDGCPVTEDVADRLLRLPLYAGMDDDDIDLVIRAVESYRPVRRTPHPAAACPK
ncbi:dTDP-4-amino-4,6-dideoxygalactose transaminase [Dactylosporangium sp. CA-139114]|uniref:dTDP-4-amino-4,6-dideoxygalactose transaminase n=1 Tax=Dactylosporangium sp. CA-139114 TaxID=3239931 RepID=UPI003D98A7FC